MYKCKDESHALNFPLPSVMAEVRLVENDKPEALGGSEKDCFICIDAWLIGVFSRGWARMQGGLAFYPR